MFQKSLHNLLFLVFAFSLIQVEKVHAFVHSRSEGGQVIKWASSKSNVKFYFNSSSNTFNDTASQNVLSQVLDDSIAEWDGVGVLNVTTQDTGNKVNGRNDIYFDNQGLLSGTNVLGVTQVVFENSSGNIVEADIILNDSINLNLFANDSFYVGNVITHEIGHALGLGHSEVGFSTMFYLATNGQYKISPDDHSAIHSLYPYDSSAASMTGKIVGGDDGKELFGVHVIAYDIVDGEVAGSTFSNGSGDFSIRGLNPDKDYGIITAPIKNKSVLPGYYQEVNADYCIGRKDIQKSFWQGCGASDEGHPVKVNLNSSQSLDLGVISVRCNIDTPVEYSLDRSSGYQLDMSEYFNLFIGHLTMNDIKEKNVDILNIDLSTEVMPSVGAGEQLFLEVSISNQDLYSMLKLQSKVVFADYSETTFGMTDVLTSDYTPKSDINFRLNLDSGLSDDNIFEIQIAGKNFETQVYGATLLPGYINDSNLGLNLGDFFPDYSQLKEESMFYVFNARIVKQEVGGNLVSLGTKESNYQKYDNRYCADAPLSYRTFPKVSNVAAQDVGVATSEQDDLASALGGCGTIAPPGSGPGGGSMQFVLSLLLGLLFTSIGRLKYRRF